MQSSDIVVCPRCVSSPWPVDDLRPRAQPPNDALTTPYLDHIDNVWSCRTCGTVWNTDQGVADELGKARLRLPREYVPALGLNEKNFTIPERPQ